MNWCHMQWMTISSSSHHRRRFQQVAAASGPHQVAGWWPPSSQSHGWFQPARRGWPRCPSSWSNSRRSKRRIWPLEILCLCWWHLSYASDWTGYPWHLDKKGSTERTRKRFVGIDRQEVYSWRTHPGNKQLNMLEWWVVFYKCGASRVEKIHNHIHVSRETIKDK